MRASGGGRALRTGVRIAPLLLPLIPKCPLCLLPLFAAAGWALPPAPVLDALVAACAAGWLGLVLATARWAPVRAAAIVAAALLVSGRLLASVPLGLLGGAAVLAVLFWTRSRPRACSEKACGVNPELLNNSESSGVQL
jgi:hypothetical protein